MLFLQPTLPPTSLVACTLIVLKRFASCCVHAYIFFSWLLSNMDFFSMPPSVYYIRLSLWSRLNMCVKRRCASHVLHPPSSRNPKISPPPPLQTTQSHKTRILESFASMQLFVLGAECDQVCDAHLALAIDLRHQHHLSNLFTREPFAQVANHRPEFGCVDEARAFFCKEYSTCTDTIGIAYSCQQTLKKQSAISRTLAGCSITEHRPSVSELNKKRNVN